MSIGFAIFLSSLMITFAIIFAKTIDKWNWKKISIIVFKIIMVLFLLLLCTGGGYYLYIQQKNKPQPPQPIEALEDIELNQSLSDVKFTKGTPDLEVDNFFGFRTDSIFGYSDKPDLFVFFDKNKTVEFIMHGGVLSCINDVCNGSHYELIIDKYGEPTKIISSTDQFDRMLFYDDYNVFYYCRENHVKALGIYRGSQPKEYIFISINKIQKRKWN